MHQKLKKIPCASSVAGLYAGRTSAIGRAAVLILLFAGACPLASGTEPGGASGPQELVRKTTQDLLAAVRTDPGSAAASVEDIVGARIEFDRLSKWVVGDYWDSFSPAQRSRFRAAYRTLVLRSLTKAVTDYGDGRVSYLRTVAGRHPTSASVATEVRRGDAAPLHITYRLVRKGDAWRLLDVVVDGVSLAKTHRADFRATLKSGGAERLIRRLEEMNSRP